MCEYCGHDWPDEIPDEQPDGRYCLDIEAWKRIRALTPAELQAWKVA